MTTQEDREREVRDALNVETRELFPKIYEGYTEADALAQSEDELLRVIRNFIYRYFQNRNLQTMNEEVIAAFEGGLGIQAVGTVDERRSAVIQRINARFVNNDQTIENRAKAAVENESIIVNTDCQALRAEVTTAPNSSSATFAELIAALKAIRAIMPQNLEAYAADRSEKIKPWKAYGAAKTTVSINAGRVEPLWGVCIFYDDDMTTTSGHKAYYIKLIKDRLRYDLASSKAIIDRIDYTKDRLDIRYKTDGIPNYTYDNTLAAYNTTRARVKACYDYVYGTFTAVDGCFGVYENAPTITQIQRLYRSDFA